MLIRNNYKLYHWLPLLFQSMVTYFDEIIVINYVRLEMSWYWQLNKWHTQIGETSIQSKFTLQKPEEDSIQNLYVAAQLVKFLFLC